MTALWVLLPLGMALASGGGAQNLGGLGGNARGPKKRMPGMGVWGARARNGWGKNGDPKGGGRGGSFKIEVPKMEG